MPNEDRELFHNFVTKLQTENDIKPILNDIKNMFSFKPPSNAKNTLTCLGVSNIIRCLDVQDKANVDLTCEVLKICFDKFGAGDVIKHFTGHIMYLLRHDKDCVRRLAVDEVFKSVKTDQSSFPVAQHIDVFVAVAQLICDKDVGVATKAVTITSDLPPEVYPKILEEMKIALDENSSSKCHAYEVVCNIAMKSPELFTLCVEHGYIDHMISELSTDDILYQLNILELLSRFAVKPYGIHYLVKEGGLDKTASLIGDVQRNPLSGLMLPGYLKFFGSIAHHYPREIFAKYPVFLNSLFEAIDSSDQSVVLPVALDTLGFIGTTIEGKLCLAAVGGQFIQAVDKVGDLIKNNVTEIKIRALNCLASLINVERDKAKSNPIDHRVTLMTREWFRSLNKPNGSMEFLFEMVKNPFPDIKLAAFILLDAVCQHMWGEQEVARVAGFVEYLLDRSVSDTKETKEARYDIIKRLARSSAFESNILTRLQKYVEDGPFYMETNLQVAMEEGD
ncbi:PREDICTED: 26S proteasome non-ATPase regulatory subunit 5 [Papilio polytes]|uniref:26S proteasome non-ATPase regulatory subunit 5 n=1 Tax=Papilio polytes TaxID=76194 RepID=UPI000675E6C5|nr:PREDICTED: 26S proteasome non-ATPase regulatory subunit 5 [Papilio polytes]